jgi:hypothetical protein
MSIEFSLKNPTLGGADSLTYRIDGQRGGNVNGVITAKEGERFHGHFDLLNYSATLDLSGLSDGWHTLTAVATGTSPYNPTGGMGSIIAQVSGSDSIQFLFDVAKPSVTILIQENQTYTTTDVPLNFTLSEKADWVGYILDEQPLVTVAGNTTLVGLSEGLHSLTVYANDTIGRSGTSEQIYFTIMQETTPETQPETSEPSPSTLVTAEPLPVYSLMMPEEYINYTISLVNGSLWAKVDGTYPLTIFEIEGQDQALWTNTEFTFTGDTLPLVYPTPPRTTNISLEMDETELTWGNYTQIHPDATHYTALGDWPMISTVIQPVRDHFTLKIHYEHPIELVDGSYAFLYDLNISPYLSPWSNKSTAYFNIKFETDYTDLQVNTIAIDGTLNPVDYMITKEDGTEAVALQLVSEYSKPLLGDLLISFTNGEELEQNKSGVSGSSLPTEYALVAGIFVAIVTMAGYLSLKHKKSITE